MSKGDFFNGWDSDGEPDRRTVMTLIERLRSGNVDADDLEAGADEIKRLKRRENIAVNALFEVCQNDWGIGHSIAKPAHRAIKELAALKGDSDA